MAARRKLTTILSADVFGYSRLMADVDRATLETLTSTTIYARIQDSLLC